MTKVKGIETKQIILEGIWWLFSIVFSLIVISNIIEANESNLYSDKEAILYIIPFLILVVLGMIEFVCIFKKMGNYVEIYAEKLSIKSFQLTILTNKSATKIADIEYKNIKSVYMEKKGIIPWLVINTTTEQYKVDVKDVERLIPMIKQKAGLK
ncbi:hypothetical protein [uncultured Eubacterium sp.]|uniref:hypothetical protein n=1 Tax=uncultured Eubacterium sp. TaxID=165185 RepID=UPI003262D378